MGVYVLNGLNGVIDVINNYESCIWNVQFWGQNDFQLIAPVQGINLSSLELGRLLCREEDVTATGYKNVMIIESITINFDADKGWTLTVSGKGLKSILARRIVWGQTTMSGTVEDAIRQIITENIISPSISNRAIADFVLGAAQSFPETSDIQLFGENIAEWLEQVCESFGYGWDVEIINSKYTFKLYKGTDRTAAQNVNSPVVFSPDFDNLLTSEYSYNKAEFKNAALVGGEGEGTSQRCASVGGAAGLKRYEAYVDGSSVSSNGEIITPEQYIELLKSYGREQLTASRYDAKFSATIDPNGMFKINQDFFLGDLVNVNNGVGISATTRITEIIYSTDVNGISVVPTFTEMEV